MNDERLEQIDARANAATPRPWAYGVYELTESFKDIQYHACTCNPETLGLYHLTGPAEDPGSQADAEFIAHARDDIPDLLEYIYELRQRNQMLSNELKVAKETVVWLVENSST